MYDSLWPMDCITTGFPVHHELLELAQTHVHWVGNGIQPSHPLLPPSHPLLSPSPPTFSLSQHQGLFQWISSLHQVAKIFEFQLQLPMNIQDWFPLGLTGWISLQPKGLNSLLQHHSSKASILQCLAFFIVQLLHPFMNTGKTIRSDQIRSVAQSCPTLCNPMNRSMPGLPVHHHLLEFTQTHVHRVSDDIQPSHPLSSPSPPAPNPSQHQSLFQWVNSSHEVAKVLEFQL